MIRNYDLFLDIDDPENFPDVTEKDTPDEPPVYANMGDLELRVLSKYTAEDFEYDPLSRKGYE